MMRETQTRASQGVTEMSDLLARIETALQRAEAAADRLGRRHTGLKIAARDTVANLDRLIESEKRSANG
ncbi:MAG: hypothetical protein ACRC1J_05375 [Sandaracinobacteroides sp.]